MKLRVVAGDAGVGECFPQEAVDSRRGLQQCVLGLSARSGGNKQNGPHGRGGGYSLEVCVVYRERITVKGDCRASSEEDKEWTQSARAEIRIQKPQE